MNEGSAKIYQFPAGGRAALGGRRYGETKSASTPRVNETALQRQLVSRRGHPRSQTRAWDH